MKISSGKNRKKPQAHTTQSDTSLTPNTLGEQLQRARMARKLDIAVVAEQLHLKPSVIRALEADDYKSLPGITFTKGYIRNYARHLGLPGDAMVRLFEQQTGALSAMDEAHPLPERPLRKPGQPGLRSAFVALALLLLGVVIAWFWTQSGGGTGQTPRMAEPQQLVEEQSLPALVEQLDASEHRRQAEAQGDSGAASAQSMKAAGNVSDAQVSPPVSMLSDGPATSNTPAIADSPSQRSETTIQRHHATAESLSTGGVAPSGEESLGEAPAADVVTSVDTVAEPAQARAAFIENIESARQAVLAMEFTDKCWIEVRDRSRTIDVKELKLEGGSLVLQGEPPFDIKLGNGDAVQLTYNGEPVSLTSGQRRGRVVVMTLGAED